LLIFMFDQPLHHGAVTAHLAEQVIEQDRFSHRAREQIFGDMRFPSQLPDQRLHCQSEPALWAHFWAFLRLGVDRVE
jgi:hypothetical protein